MQKENSLPLKQIIIATCFLLSALFLGFQYSFPLNIILFFSGFIGFLLRLILSFQKEEETEETTTIKIDNEQ